MTTKNNNNGVTGLEVLTILFISLKLLKIIDWSWWWILSPIWIIPAVVGCIFVLVWIIDKLCIKRKKT